VCGLERCAEVAVVGAFGCLRQSDLVSNVQLIREQLEKDRGGNGKLGRSVDQ
jgi:hypothetical protein